MTPFLVLQSRTARTSKTNRVRNDLSVQRLARINGLYGTLKSRLAKQIKMDPDRAAAQARFEKALRRAFALYILLEKYQASLQMSKTLFPLRELKNRMRSGRRMETKIGRVHFHLSHQVHDIHLQLISLQPLMELEACFHSTLFDLEEIAAPGSYKRFAENSLGRHLRSILDSDHTAGMSQPGAPPRTPQNYEPLLRTYLIQVVNETRRQALAQTQVEIIRDEITFELTTACFRLMITLIAAFVIFYCVSPASFEEPLLLAGFMTAIGGILGSFLSATNRIGKMSDNHETGRTMMVLASSIRSIYFTPAIGVAGAWVAFMAISGRFFSLFDFGNSPSDPTDSLKYFSGAFMLGITAGFSERLVPDIVDKFNKTPERK